ncbi:MAG: carotenoid biosynthesis protein [Blastocatellia bacterium]|nr:carotenoid biosynthesis protein [Blastocatellia bacterium]
MFEILRLLVGTVTLRPYVFAFLAAYLFLAITKIGWRRASIFTVIAYLIAFVCEYSSIHNGFPFGLYYYISGTEKQELWIAGVPFMDSLSFTFLSYVSFEMALLLRSPLSVTLKEVKVLSDEQTEKKLRNSWATSLLAGLLMMFLDIVIDPVALQGERWFLGKLYYYPNGGQYFGITIANFAGWFFVCVLILRVYIFIEKMVVKETAGILNYPFKALAPAGLYFGILLFNVTMTFLIGEETMGWASTFITTLLILLLVLHLSYCRQIALLETLLRNKS